MIANTSHPPHTVRNYVGVVCDVSPSSIVVETELFPREALEFYTRHNLLLCDPDHNPADAKLYDKYYNAARGGGQGDYRKDIQAKIDNVVDCLSNFPRSKRAVITIPSHTALDHTVDEDAKCLRELHFFLEPTDDASPEHPQGAEDKVQTNKGVKLHCTGIMRAQAAAIFPKNIHFIGSIMNLVADRLGVPVGCYTHMVTTFTSDRAT